jgi:hypothetical protein
MLHSIPLQRCFERRPESTDGYVENNRKKTSNYVGSLETLTLPTKPHPQQCNHVREETTFEEDSSNASTPHCSIYDV